VRSQRPRWITRLADGQAVEGIGFKDQADGGCVEIGYGLAPSARGHGYAAEALVALLAIAADHGLSRVIRNTLSAGPDSTSWTPTARSTITRRSSTSSMDPYRSVPNDLTRACGDTYVSASRQRTFG
jgi:GNAT superfamily N-acetyltransferase